MDVNNEYDRLVDDFIQVERRTESNPFLATRIMEAVKKDQRGNIIKLSPVLKAALVSTGLAATIFIGIWAGSFYKSTSESSAIMLLNDQEMEHFAFYNQTGEE